MLKIGYVYFIRIVGTNLLKIGESYDPKKRLKELQGKNGTKMPLMVIENSFICKNPKEKEKYLHDFFKDHKINGEWFNVVQKINYDFPEMVEDSDLSSFLFNIRSVDDGLYVPHIFIMKNILPFLLRFNYIDEMNNLLLGYNIKTLKVFKDYYHKDHKLKDIESFLILEKMEEIKHFDFFIFIYRTLCEIALETEYYLDFCAKINTYFSALQEIAYCYTKGKYSENY